MGGNVFSPDASPTLGEVGYEAYRASTGGKSLVSGADIPAFTLLSPEIQAAWEAAGNAISASVGRADAGQIPSGTAV